MRTRKRVLIPSFILLILIGFILYASYWLFKTIEQNQTLLKTNQKINELNIKDTSKLKKRLVELEQKQVVITEQKKELIRHKKVDVIINYYKKHGTLQQYPWITPKHIYNVIYYIEKYQHKDYNFDSLDPVNFVIAWAGNGMNFDPNGKNYNKWNKTYDMGIMDINQCNFWMRDKAPADLRSRTIYDTELSIWIWWNWVKNKQANQKSCWQIWNEFREEGGKEIYYMLKEVKYD